MGLETQGWDAVLKFGVYALSFTRVSVAPGTRKALSKGIPGHAGVVLGAIVSAFIAKK